ncbi:MAG: hypothetical protein LAQ30_22985 [Acidobacteriia bacterium]|nr:hypothetical protein [Terriglobia bacterium]
MPRLLSCLLALFALPAAGLRVDAWQQSRPPAPLSVEEVVKLTQAGFSDEVIITKIKKNGKAFDLSTEELLDLKKVGVKDSVINYLLDPSLPYSPPPPPAPAPVAAPAKAPEKPAAPPPPAVPPKQYPKDPYAARTPPDPGLYRFAADSPVSLELKSLLGTRQGPGLGKVLMKKGAVIAYLAGAASTSRMKGPSPRFYLRLPPGKGIDELVLLALERKSGRREIGMGTGPKQEIRPQAVRQFESAEVGPNLFRLSPEKLAKGEYLFFFLGSAEPPKGSYGKGYDFGVD